MLAALSTDGLEAIRRAAARSAELRLLVLHGSRARGDAREDSDWDFAYLADPGFDPDDLLARMTERLRADRVDLADLARDGGQLHYRVARDGVALFERSTGEWDRSCLDAVTFWRNAAPVIEAASDVLLAELPR